MKGVARKIFIWIFGLLAGGIAGGLIADGLSNTGDAVVFGFLGGCSAFACLRLWVGERSQLTEGNADG